MDELPHKGKGQVCLPQEREVVELGKRHQRGVARAARLKSDQCCSWLLDPVPGDKNQMLQKHK